MKITGGLLCVLSWFLVIGIVGGIEYETMTMANGFATLIAALAVGVIGCVLLSEKKDR